MFEALNDKEKITTASVKARLSEAEAGDVDVAEAGEIPLLKKYLELTDKSFAASARLKVAQEKLTAAVFAKYGKLSEDEIKELVVDDKWLATVAAAVQGELDRVSQTLTGRITQLAERYATPLPLLTDEVEALSDKVAGHLAKMGFKP